MLKLAIPVILAATAGISLVVQQALNANLRAALNSAAWSGFMSYFIGVICMVVLALVLQDPLPSAATAARIPWFAWSGGLFGAIFVALAIFLVPQLGAAAFFALLIAGQMLGSDRLRPFWLAGPAGLHLLSARSGSIGAGVIGRRGGLDTPVAHCFAWRAARTAWLSMRTRRSAAKD